MTTESIATAQGDMTNMNAVLNDDRTYLKDLTIKCELKARLRAFRDHAGPDRLDGAGRHASRESW
jgi:hypothetical protein